MDMNSRRAGLENRLPSIQRNFQDWAAHNPHHPRVNIIPLFVARLMPN